MAKGSSGTSRTGTSAGTRGSNPNFRPTTLNRNGSVLRGRRATRGNVVR